MRCPQAPVPNLGQNTPTAANTPATSASDSTATTAAMPVQTSTQATSSAVTQPPGQGQRVVPHPHSQSITQNTPPPQHLPSQHQPPPSLPTPQQDDFADFQVASVAPTGNWPTAGGVGDRPPVSTSTPDSGTVLPGRGGSSGTPVVTSQPALLGDDPYASLRALSASTAAEQGKGINLYKLSDRWRPANNK